jgi:subtilase family serine protease
MRLKSPPFFLAAPRRAGLALCLALALTGCGGGGGFANTAPDATAAGALGTVTLELNLLQLPQAAAALEARPMGLTAPTALPVDGSTQLTPMAVDGDYTTYTPAQVRSAYGMPALPNFEATISPAQTAAMGAGQTIYLVTAFRDAHIAHELAAFNTRFGLPPCQVRRLEPSQTLPLPAASPSGCELLVVANTSAGGISAALPDYNMAWAHEAALDVQWAHATAPLARLVLIEAQDGSLSSLLGAIKLANAMGSGVVSMSFGCPEGPWTDAVDTLFSNDAMSYVAATGDTGPEVAWPAVSPRVLAVGGTSLRYGDGATRSEAGWSATGGGFSSFTAAPSYQTSTWPGLAGQVGRGVADVAFNADPNTGQYVARMAPGATTPTWTSAGGTSLATVQWAGLLAVANAQRALAGKPALGAPHALLYGQIAALPRQYAQAFSDITRGNNGGCASCATFTGYDTPTGLGTPQTEALLAMLVQSQTNSTGQAAPNSGAAGTAIRADAFAGTSGKPFSASIAFSDPAAARLTVTIAGVPKGVSWVISGATVLAQWSSPMPGTYPLVVSARNDLGRTTQAQVALTVR